MYCKVREAVSLRPGMAVQFCHPLTSAHLLSILPSSASIPVLPSPWESPFSGWSWLGTIGVERTVPPQPSTAGSSPLPSSADTQDSTTALGCRSLGLVFQTGYSSRNHRGLDPKPPGLSQGPSHQGLTDVPGAAQADRGHCGSYLRSGVPALNQSMGPFLGAQALYSPTEASGLSQELIPLLSQVL